LQKLLWIYDNNKISIEGKTSLSFSEDVGAALKAYGCLSSTSLTPTIFRASTAPLKKLSSKPINRRHRRQQPHRIRRAYEAGPNEAHGERSVKRRSARQGALRLAGRTRNSSCRRSRKHMHNNSVRAKTGKEWQAKFDASRKPSRPSRSVRN